MNKQDYIMKFIFQKIQEGYEVKKIDKDIYEFRIINKNFIYTDFVTLDILPYVEYIDEIKQDSNYKNGFNILN